MLFQPWVALGVVLLIVWQLSRMALLSWADLSYVLPVTSVGYVLVALIGKVLLNEQITRQALGRHRADHGRRGAGERRQRSFHRTAKRTAGGSPMKWLLVALMVGATTAGEVLQAAGMRRHGEIRDFRPGAIGRALARAGAQPLRHRRRSSPWRFRFSPS